jgi:hypothetical protein
LAHINWVQFFVLVKNIKLRYFCVYAGHWFSASYDGSLMAGWFDGEKADWVFCTM